VGNPHFNTIFCKLGMPVYSEHAIAAYFAYFPHIFCAYFKLDRSAYFGKNLHYKLACLVTELNTSRELLYLILCISQGSVVTHLRCGGKQHMTTVTFTAEASLLTLDCVSVTGLTVTVCADSPAAAFDFLSSNLFGPDTDRNDFGTCRSTVSSNSTQ